MHYKNNARNSFRLIARIFLFTVSNKKNTYNLILWLIAYEILYIPSTMELIQN